MQAAIPSSSLFHPDNEVAYQHWRERKLADYPQHLEALSVDIQDPFKLNAQELQSIQQSCAKANLVPYRLSQPADKAAIRALGRQLGLEHLDHNLCADADGIASLQVIQSGRPQDYIPYSNRPINWHTDGYYNPLDQQISGVILHCVCDALTGGENAYLDHEIAYILLRDANPDYIHALMQTDVMSIPPNIENGVELRPLQTGPVFSVSADGRLHMRYTARARHIIWKSQAETLAAINFLIDLFESDLPYIFRYRMQPNQGVICNNVLHKRSAFENAAQGGQQQRLLYRARYFDPIRPAIATG